MLKSVQKPSSIFGKDKAIYPVLNLEEYDHRNFVMLELLGHGEYGVVYKAFEKKTRIFVALKFIESNFEDSEESLREHFMLKNISEFKKPNNLIVHYATYKDSRKLEKEGKIILVLSMELGVVDMHKMVKLRKKYIESEIFYILEDLSKSLLLLKRNKICHGDIKTADIALIQGNDGFSYKLIDYGMSYRVENNLSETNFQLVQGMTRFYASPELREIFLKKSTEKFDPFQADIYALGVLCLKLMGLSNEFINEIKEELNKLDPFQADYPNLIILIKKLLKIDLNQRPSIENLGNELKIQAKSKPDENFFVKNFQDTRILSLKDLECEKYAKIYFNQEKFSTALRFIYTEIAKEAVMSEERRKFWKELKFSIQECLKKFEDLKHD